MGEEVVLEEVVAKKRRAMCVRNMVMATSNWRCSETGSRAR